MTALTVGSAVLTDCVPMVEDLGPAGDGTRDCPPALLLSGLDGHMWLAPTGANVEDQRPFGNYQPGNWAWLLDDVKPTTERCPACWGKGIIATGRQEANEYRCLCGGGCGPWGEYPCSRCGGTGVQFDPLQLCDVCDGKGSCDPIPARGRQRVWRWTP